MNIIIFKELNEYDLEIKINDFLDENCNCRNPRYQLVNITFNTNGNGYLCAFVTYKLLDERV